MTDVAWGDTFAQPSREKVFTRESGEKHGEIRKKEASTEGVHQKECGDESEERRNEGNWPGGIRPPKLGPLN